MTPVKDGLTATDPPPLPSRYAPLFQLGRGGGGEVWAVEDRLTGDKLALKLLAEDASPGEVDALIREATALSGLEGLGVPRIFAFGAVGGQRRYLVRELVPGTSLEGVLRRKEGPWLAPLLCAADQLTVLHRTGLLHGDVKPANVIVGEDGTGTLVDLGLAMPWREGGVLPSGLTPKYAAPELLRGAPLTVRAEVYALGATLAEALHRRQGELDPATQGALESIADRATKEEPRRRFPSVDEMVSAIRTAAAVPPSAAPSATAWPILGIEGTTAQILEQVALLEPGRALALEGPWGSGRTTLARRVAWALGIRGAPVVYLDPRGATGGGRALGEIVAEEAKALGREAIFVADDLLLLDEAAKTQLRRASDAGARVVGVGPVTLLEEIVGHPAAVFAVPSLGLRVAEDLASQAVPSLARGLVEHLVLRTGGRPGALRAFVNRARDRAIVSVDDVDALLEASQHVLAAPPRTRAEKLEDVDRALSTGRFDDAEAALDALGDAESDLERVDMAVMRAKVALARGELGRAAEVLDQAKVEASSTGRLRAWAVTRARVMNRAGDFANAATMARAVTGPRDALSADALSVRGVALAYTGELAEGKRELEAAVTLARELELPRVLAVAHGSLAIVHQRAGEARLAREAYEAALSCAELAKDAWTVTTTRLNLAGLARAEGDLASAAVHLEAAVDMGQRAGARLAVQQALLNLANLDLYLGRYARAEASIATLRGRSHLAADAKAQLLGLEAELAARTGDPERGARLYDLSADAWDAASRPLDAAEARLEGILAKSTRAGADAAALGRDVEALASQLGDGGFREHEPLAAIVRGTLYGALGDDTRARAHFDRAITSATSAGRQEWAWRALEARARLSHSEGATALAGRDVEAALVLLEESARKLPRDLREVFWNDPRRQALKMSLSRTIAEASLATRSPQGHAILPIRRSGNTTIGAVRVLDDRLSRVLEITRELARERDMERLLERVIDHAVALASAERGVVLLVGDGGELYVHTAHDLRGDEATKTFSRSVAERVLRSGEPVLATSAMDDERLREAASVHQLAIQSVACVPIRGAPPVGRPIGALYIETTLRPGARFEDALETLVAFADQAAIAIENARLVSELESTNRELAAAKDRLAGTLGRKTEQLAATRRDLKQARAQLRSHFGYGGLVGTSAAMRKLYAVIDRVKDTDVPVLITGESGTGKEIVARAIHSTSERGKGPFLGVNCGAIPENLLESELFGSVRGAFTGAEKDRKGLFREASGGTILLDEIGEMPLRMQAGLLRVLQERTVRPVGATHEEAVDARVIAATNRELANMVADGRFREDLFYRLDVVEVRVPPVRERPDDVPLLIDHFLSLFAARYGRERKTVERAAMRKLTAHDWPGNVRQLEHVLLNAWLMSEGSEILTEDLALDAAPRSIGGGPSSMIPERTRDGAAKTEEEHKDSEKERILAALASCNWNRVQAARMVGIPRRTFYRRLKDYGIV